MSGNQMWAMEKKADHVLLGLVASLMLVFLIWTTPAISATSEESASAIASLNAGTAAIQSGRALAAIDYFNAAIESNALSPEGSALAYHHRGIAHQKLGLSGHAVADYTNAIWQGGLPETVLPRSYYNRAVAYAQMGQQDRAERDYDKAIELAPDYAAAFHNRGNLRRHLGNHAASIEDYSRALDLGMGGQEHLTFFARALSHNALGNQSASLDDTARALELKPDFDAARKAFSEWGGSSSTNIASAPAPADPIVTASIAPPVPATQPSVALAPTIAVAPVAATPAGNDQRTAQADPWRQAPPRTPAPAAERPVFERTEVANLDAVRIPIAGPAGQRPVKLSPPDVAALEPQTGSVTVTPLAHALPPARATAQGAQGWQTTVQRFATAQVAPRAEPRRVAAVPAETGLTTASINGDARLPTRPQSDLTAPRVSNRQPQPINTPIRIAQNNATTANDAGSAVSAPGRRVQVGSFRSAAEATSAWDRIANAHRALIGQKQPYIVEADLGARGTYYRLQIGPLGSSNEVKALCRALKLQGQDCIPAL
jgi:tetratricopeptide (TPR) repeat protein